MQEEAGKHFSFLRTKGLGPLDRRRRSDNISDLLLFFFIVNRQMGYHLRDEMTIRAKIASPSGTKFLL